MPDGQFLIPFNLKADLHGFFELDQNRFTTDDAATKLIYLAIREFEKTGRCVREWVAARNQFAILYPERLNK